MDGTQPDHKSPESQRQGKKANKTVIKHISIDDLPNKGFLTMAQSFLGLLKTFTFTNFYFLW